MVTQRIHPGTRFVVDEDICLTPKQDAAPSDMSSRSLRTYRTIVQLGMQRSPILQGSEERVIFQEQILQMEH